MDLGARSDDLGMLMRHSLRMSPRLIEQELRAPAALHGVRWASLAYEMLTGRVPFDSDEPVRLMFAHVHDEVPPIAKVAPHVRIGPRVEALVGQAPRKRPSDRHASARDFADALLEDVDPQEPRLLHSLRWLFTRRR